MKTTEQYAKEVLDKHNVILTSAYSGAHNSVTFLCPNGHENKTTATNLLQRGYKCKSCIESRTIVSKIVWDVDKLLKLQDYFDQHKSTKEIAELFNTTVAAINNATAKYELTKPKIALHNIQEAISDQGRTIEGTPTALKASAYITCQNGHRVYQNLGNILYKGTNCPLCNKTTSNEEKGLVDYIKSIYQGWIIENDRSILEGQELDIVLPDLGIAIEYNGTYWHSELFVDKKYHLNKTIKASNLGFRVIHINSYDWVTKTNLVKAKIKHIIAPSKPELYARKTKITKISWQETKEFLTNHHIQGPGAPTNINLALKHNNTIVAVMTFAKPRFDTSADYELVRFAANSVHGAAGKLLKYFIKHYKPKDIISYALRDYSTGDLYQKLGFKLIRYTEPNYAYYNKLNKVTRYAAQNHDPKVSEVQAMHERGFYRVYDTGSLVFRLTT